MWNPFKNVFGVHVSNCNNMNHTICLLFEVEYIREIYILGRSYYFNKIKEILMTFSLFLLKTRGLYNTSFLRQ